MRKITIPKLFTFVLNYMFIIFLYTDMMSNISTGSILLSALYATLFNIVLILIEGVIHKFSMKQLMCIVLGIICGFTLFSLFSTIIQRFAILMPFEFSPLQEMTSSAISLLTFIYISTDLILNNVDKWHLEIPFIRIKKISASKPILLDENALMDPILIKLLQTGLVTRPIVIPQFLINSLKEAYANSDITDEIRRAHSGLKIVEHLQFLPQIKTIITKQNPKHRKKQKKYIVAANQINADIMTSSLDKPEQIRSGSLHIYNLQLLQRGLIETITTGNEFDIITEEVDENNSLKRLQGNTLITMENGKHHVGKKLKVSVASISNTIDGKIIHTKKTKTDD